MTKWIEDSSYFELLEIFETEKVTKGVTMGNRRFIEARKELIKRYKKHSEAYKFWLGRVYKERLKILVNVLFLFSKSKKRINERDFISRVNREIYNIYSTNVSKQNERPLNTYPFIDKLITIEGSRTKIKIFPQQENQNTPMSRYKSTFTETELADIFAYHVHPVGRIKNSKFKHRPSIGRTVKMDNSRITLRLVPNKALVVFEEVAKKIVGSDDSKWEMISSAKIMGPTKLPKSVDSMIIYINSRDRTVIKNIIDFLIIFTEDHFLPGGPMGMFELSKGITYADSSDPKRGKSFGSSRGKTINEKLASLLWEALNDPKKDTCSIVNSMAESMLHLGTYKSMGATLDYTMPAFRRPFSNMAIDPYGHHRRK